MHISKLNLTLSYYIFRCLNYFIEVLILSQSKIYINQLKKKKKES